LETKTLNKRDKKEKFVMRLTILLDVGGIITDKRQRTEQWHFLIGDYFAPLFGRTAQEWNTAHQIVTERLLEQGEAIQQATPDFIAFHHTCKRSWLSGMYELLGLPIPAEEECIALADQAIASISSRIQAALPGAVEAIQTLHSQGFLLHTASGTHSVEIAGYLEAVGVRTCFGRCYGADLINTFKQGPEYFERLFANLGLRPAEALVVDDGSDVLGWAAQVGARTVLVGPASHSEKATTACIGSLVELPAWLQQQALC
jgi:HAD superfamily hydrolase (TIGR01509 family)